MNEIQDIRWKQRFSNYEKALNKLKNAIENYDLVYKKEPNYNSDFLEQLRELIIKRFELTFELAWNVMKDYATSQSIPKVNGSRDAVKAAFKLELITNYQVWFDSIESRNKATHSYDEEVANEVFFDIMDKYFSEFQIFYNTMKIKLVEDKISIGLLDSQIEKMQEVFAKYPEIESAIVFGSRAKGNYKYNSDIDIVIKGENASNVSGDIVFDLEDLGIPFEIDLKVFNTISNQELIEHINRVGVSIYVRQ